MVVDVETRPPAVRTIDAVLTVASPILHLMAESDTHSEPRSLAVVRCTFVVVRCEVNTNDVQ